MDNKPILHEPGYPNPSVEMREGYNKMVEYSCMQYIIERAEKLNQRQPDAFMPFITQFKERLPQILNNLEERLTKKVKEGDISILNLPYRLHLKTNYKTVLERVVKLKAALII
jgi:hypothetical protein